MVIGIVSQSSANLCYVASCYSWNSNSDCIAISNTAWPRMSVLCSALSSAIECVWKLRSGLLTFRGGSTEGPRGGGAPNEKCGPHFVPASLDFHLNRPVISLIQLHIVPPPPPPAGIVPPPIVPICPVPEPPLLTL